MPKSDHSLSSFNSPGILLVIHKTPSIPNPNRGHRLVPCLPRLAKPSPSLSVISLQALTPRLRRRRILVSKSCAIDISNFFRHPKGRRMDRSGQRMEEGGQMGDRRHEEVARDRAEPRRSVARTPRLRNKRPEQTRASGMIDDGCHLLRRNAECMRSHATQSDISIIHAPKPASLCALPRR